MCVIEILEVHTHGTKVRFRLLTSEKTTLLTSRSTASLQHGLSVMGGQSSPWHVLSVFVGLHVLITKYKCGWIPSFTGPEGSSEWEILYSCDYLQVQVIASQKLNFLHLFVQLFRSHILFFLPPHLKPIHMSRLACFVHMITYLVISDHGITFIASR